MDDFAAFTSPNVADCEENAPKPPNLEPPVKGLVSAAATVAVDSVFENGDGTAESFAPNVTACAANAPNPPEIELDVVFSSEGLASAAGCPKPPALKAEVGFAAPKPLLPNEGVFAPKPLAPKDGAGPLTLASGETLDLTAALKNPLAPKAGAGGA